MVNEDKKVLMLPLDDDSSKTVVQAISNETARKILENFDLPPPHTGQNLNQIFS